jgi:endonuclease/exonuclease/phosphatase family metal-dependent hydrolase
MQVASTHRRFNRVRNAVLFGPSWHVAGTEVVDLSGGSRTMRRGFVAVSLRSSEARVVAVSAHLGLSTGERRRHARELTDHVIGEGRPAILGVDLNEGPTGDAARWMAGRMFDAFARAGKGDGATFPAASPSARIDYLFVTEEVTVREASVPPFGNLSDHRPVVADVEVEQG